MMDSTSILNRTKNGHPANRKIALLTKKYLRFFFTLFVDLFKTEADANRNLYLLASDW